MNTTKIAVVGRIPHGGLTREITLAGRALGCAVTSINELPEQLRRRSALPFQAQNNIAATWLDEQLFIADADVVIMHDSDIDYGCVAQAVRMGEKPRRLIIWAQENDAPPLELELFARGDVAFVCSNQRQADRFTDRGIEAVMLEQPIVQVDRTLEISEWRVETIKQRLQRLLGGAGE